VVGLAPRLQLVRLMRAAATSLFAALVLGAVGASGCGESAAPEPRPDPPAPCAGPGTICTIAGSGLPAFDGDGKAALETALYWPLDLEFAPDGRAYLVDWQSHRIRRVDADGHVRTVIGSDLPGDGPSDMGDMRPEGAPGTDVELNHPTDLQFMPDGTMLLAAWHNHKIRRFDPATGRVRVICGGGPGDNASHVPAERALLNQPKSIAVYTRGGTTSVYVADSRNQRLRIIDADGIIDAVAGNGRADFAGDGGPPAEASFRMQELNENPEPGGSITADADGRLYLADTFNNRIRLIDLAKGMVSTIAGNGARGSGGDGGPALAAALNRPRDLELGPDGRLYVADTDNHRIRAIDLQTGIITTVVGSGEPGFSGDGGPADAAQLHRPFGVAFDGAGQLYIADTFNNRIRKVVRP
jgi:sugar lactone lactonase YvrE